MSPVLVMSGYGEIRPVRCILHADTDSTWKYC